MSQLPRKVGDFTLTRQVHSGPLSERFLGILDSPVGKQVSIRRLGPDVTADRQLTTAIENRIADLLPIKHALLVEVLDLVIHLRLGAISPEGATFHGLLHFAD